MLNQVILVGKVVSIKPELRDKELFKTRVTIEIARVNEDSHDRVEVVFDNNIGRSIDEYLKEGSTIGVKARLRNSNIELSNAIEVVGEKLTFINSRSED